MYKIKQISFNDGKQHDLGELTIILGPNGSGKSRALREIERLIESPLNQYTTIVKQLQTQRPDTYEELVEDYGLRPTAMGPGVTTWGLLGLNSSLSGMRNLQMGGPQDPTPALQEGFGPESEARFGSLFGPLLCARLGTEERLTIAKRGPNTLQFKQAQTLLQQLYLAGADGEKRVNDILHRTFGLRIRLDYSSPGELVIRIGDDNILSVSTDPREAIEQLAQYEVLDEEGDGLRSFVTVLLAVDILRRPVTLLDEPEAFLHPPQAYQLGHHLGASATGQQLIIATHSTEMLRGLLDSNKNATILRLTRDGTTNNTNLLREDVLTDISRDPLLNSARILDGLFYRGVVVTEADSDRAFYGSVSARLNPNSGLHFTHAQNKQTIPRIVRAYKSIGIPVASIVDLDLLRSRTELQSYLEAHKVSPATSQTILLTRDRVSGQMEAEKPEDRFTRVLNFITAKVAEISKSTNSAEDRLRSLGKLADKVAYERDPWRAVKAAGLSAFGPLKSDAEGILEGLIRYGIFLVPVGELEGWLSEYDLPKNDKRAWISAALSLLPGLEVQPARKPWNFVNSVITYMA